jgi:hypothetical protein
MLPKVLAAPIEKVINSLQAAVDWAARAQKPVG